MPAGFLQRGEVGDAVEAQNLTQRRVNKVRRRMISPRRITLFSIDSRCYFITNFYRTAFDL